MQKPSAGCITVRASASCSNTDVLIKKKKAISGCRAQLRLLWLCLTLLLKTKKSTSSFAYTSSWRRYFGFPHGGMFDYSLRAGESGFTTLLDLARRNEFGGSICCFHLHKVFCLFSWGVLILSFNVASKIKGSRDVAFDAIHLDSRCSV